MATAKRGPAKKPAKKTTKTNGKAKPKGRRGTAYATVQLDDQEVAGRSEALANLLTEIEAQETALKDHSKIERDELKGKRQDARKLRDAVLNHEEPREVDVEFVIQGDLVATIRVGTGEVLDTRPATDKDRQGDIFGGG